MKQRIRSQMSSGHLFGGNPQSLDECSAGKFRYRADMISSADGIGVHSLAFFQVLGQKEFRVKFMLNIGDNQYVQKGIEIRGNISGNG